MPTENKNPETPQTADDPKEYIRNLADLGTDMVAKTQAEMDRSEAHLQLPKYESEKGKEEMRGAIKASNFVRSTESIANEMKDSAGEVMEKVVIDKEILSKFTDNFNFLYKELKRRIPEELLDLAKEDLSVATLGKEIKKISSLMEGFKNIESELIKSNSVYNSLLPKLKEHLAQIEGEAEKLWIEGSQRVLDSRELAKTRREREKKEREIIDNAKKNLEPLKRTMERTSADKFKELGSEEYGKFIAPNVVKETQDIYDNAYTKQVEKKLNKNLLQKGKTEEEIQQNINNAKQRIKDAIREEQQRNVPTTKAPSSYTTLQS